MQVTCHCTAYSFPHRLGGGNCNASLWCEYIWQNLHEEYCTTCNCNNNNACDVVNTAESVKHCEMYRYLKHSETWTNMPKTTEQLYEEAQEDYYNQRE